MSWVRSHKVIVALVVLGVCWYLYTQTTAYQVAHADMHSTTPSGGWGSVSIQQRAASGGF